MAAPNLTALKDRRRFVDAYGAQMVRRGKRTPGQAAGIEEIRARYNPELYGNPAGAPDLNMAGQPRPVSAAPTLPPRMGYGGFSMFAPPDLRVQDANSMRDSSVAMENANNPMSDRESYLAGLEADMYGNMVGARGKPSSFAGEMMSYSQGAPQFEGAPNLTQPTSPGAPDLSQRAIESEFAQRQAMLDAMAAEQAAKEAATQGQVITNEQTQGWTPQQRFQDEATEKRYGIDKQAEIAAPDIDKTRSEAERNRAMGEYYKKLAEKRTMDEAIAEMAAQGTPSTRGKLPQFPDIQVGQTVINPDTGERLRWNGQRWTPVE